MRATAVSLSRSPPPASANNLERLRYKTYSFVLVEQYHTVADQLRFLFRLGWLHRRRVPGPCPTMPFGRAVMGRLPNQLDPSLSTLSDHEWLGVARVVMGVWKPEGDGNRMTKPLPFMGEFDASR